VNPLRVALGALSIVFLVSVPIDALAKGRGWSRSGGGGETTVRSHTRRDGTYVPGHQRTNPDWSKGNNWSSRGNVNPYTGKPGTKNPY
jgi:hypothetical protein